MVLSVLSVFEIDNVYGPYYDQARLQSIACLRRRACACRRSARRTITLGLALSQAKDRTTVALAVGIVITVVFSVAVGVLFAFGVIKSVGADASEMHKCAQQARARSPPSPTMTIGAQNDATAAVASLRVR